MATNNNIKSYLTKEEVSHSDFSPLSRMSFKSFHLSFNKLYRPGFVLSFYWNTVVNSFRQVAADVRTLYEIYCKYKAVLVDPAEFACLKAIVLFRPETRGLKDPAQIENLQDQAHVSLIR